MPGTAHPTLTIRSRGNSAVPQLWTPELELTAGTFVLRLEGTTRPTLDAEVLKPCDLRETHGFIITPELITQLRDEYDPVGIELAALKFDHVWGGPAHGWCPSVSVDDRGHLWMHFEDLSHEAVEGIRSKQWIRQSAELTLRHPATQKPYLTGLAMLGANGPAVNGLKPLEVNLHRPVFALGQPEALPMKTQSTTPPPAETSAEPTPPPVVPAADPAAVNLSAQLAETQRLTRELEAANAAARKAQADARQVAAEGRADKEIAKLGTRVTPAMLRGGLREALVHLAGAETPAVIKLSRQEGEKTVTDERPVFDVLLAALFAAPENALLAAGELAGANADQTARLARDTRDDATRAIDEQNGITAARRLELQRKFPGTFADELPTN